MKNIIKKIAILMSISAFAISLVGCGEKAVNDEIEKQNESSENTVVENNEVTESVSEIEEYVEENNEDIIAPAQLTYEGIDDALIGAWKNDSLGVDFIYTFNPDGTGNYNAAGSIMEFTYGVSEGKISILYPDDSFPFDTEYSINGTTLNVVDTVGEDTLYEKVLIEE